MSQEIQISNSYPPTAADYWTQGQAAVGGPVNAPRQSPLKRAHRLLRGRYPLATFLAVFGAIAGSAALYTLLPPKWESRAIISVDPIIYNPGTADGIMPMWTMYVASQSQLIESIPVAEAALADSEFTNAWNKLYPNAAPMAAADFIAEVSSDRAKTTGNIIQVAFDDRDKDIAQAGARATISAYMRLYGDKDSSSRIQKIKLAEKDQNKINSNLSFARSSLQNLAEKYSTTDLAGREQAVQEGLAKTELELSQTRIAYDAAAKAQAAGSPTTAPVDKEIIYGQIAAVDLGMRDALGARRQQRDNLELAYRRWGRAHPLYATQWEIYQQRVRDVDEYARGYLQAHPTGIPNAIDITGGGPATVAELKKRLDALEALHATQSTNAKEIGAQRTDITSKQQEIAQLELDQKRVADRLDALQAQQELAKNITVIDNGSEAINTGSKKRYIAAGAGFLFGGFLPIGLLLLYSMTDARFRFSDETSESDMAGVTLLGILPNLPDRLSDPQQAGIAAHCVHQIRTMLQISRSNDEPQVVAVTSAAPGDGKTSLTLALGLSYAACGARTLLIDCDLAAAGLSHRLNVNSPEGVLEAVANRALLEFVRTTDIADVAILPVGMTHAHHASTLSPVALRRLLNESKKHFDIILVDTGPILGSIEASLVCAAADRTILTVARGQQRPLVERSIGHLQAIGARLAGVVFNRAQARDFERSLSGIALRTRSTNGSGATNGGTAQAATAKAVAGSFKRAV